MRKIFFYSLSVLFLSLGYSCSSQKVTNNSDKLIVSNKLKWSERMTLSEIHRFPDPTLLDFREKPKWSYTNGLVLDAMYKVYKQTNNTKIYDYIYDFGNRMINQNGEIMTYKMSDYNLDMIKSGDAILDLYEKTNEERFRIALKTLDKQLIDQPTTTEGGYWHKKVYPSQMWLDGVYMAEPFHARYAATFQKEQEANQAFDKIIVQFDLIEKYNRDPKTGLYYHGWDESKNEKWANKTTGLSQHFWSRGMGWYGMALVDVLDYLPKNHAGRPKLIHYLNQYAEAIVKVQDQTGTWYQVLDQRNRQGNYLEATGTAMFVYTLAKGTNKGYIPKKYKNNAIKGYQGILDQFIQVDENGIVNLTKCCSVAGLGGKPYRDGSYDYYINEPIRANDPKGTGPFILASLELNK
ncbi:unsaturated rhamnogalacturonyl hydrolase [Algoriella xinjiangensis]|uniref:Unsaturated rhamnogalacturonyl hydrolase n=1 Tax=Algoriella xinjiangensis TaxID=684065 RepID=A0A1I4SFK8_9FLAO|nr:glycoside hydrolase family 88 protein [Algoriella xinjiangensis]SFM63110.1 unsaturated rhamnogalacturonyl hydrolase [Algoriella xinjiangensis]VDH16037.1 Unsaturated rhamnogalacturonyl hydrolase YteR [Algoriella xinjiangensis]